MNDSSIFSISFKHHITGRHLSFSSFFGLHLTELSRPQVIFDVYIEPALFLSPDDVLQLRNTNCPSSYRQLSAFFFIGGAKLSLPQWLFGLFLEILAIKRLLKMLQWLQINIHLLDRTTQIASIDLLQPIP